MELIFNDLYRFIDNNDQESACHLSIFQNGSRTICIASQIWGHPGTNIHFVAEKIANSISCWYSLAPQDLTYVEHQPSYREPVSGLCFFVESFKLLSFSVGLKGNFYSPSYEETTRQVIERMVSQSLPDFRNDQLLNQLDVVPSTRGETLEHLYHKIRSRVTDCFF